MVIYEGDEVLLNLTPERFFRIYSGYIRYAGGATLDSEGVYGYAVIRDRKKYWIESPTQGWPLRMMTKPSTPAREITREEAEALRGGAEPY